MSDLTSCEVCGMRWTSRLREMCPRCALEDAKRRAEEATARARMLTKERDNWEEMCSDNAERANAAERRAEEAERVLSVAGASLGIDVEIPQDLITHIGVLKAERDAARAEAEALRKALEALVERFDKAQRHATAEIVRRALASAGQTTDAPRSPAAPEEGAK